MKKQMNPTEHQNSNFIELLNSSLDKTTSDIHKNVIKRTLEKILPNHLLFFENFQTEKVDHQRIKFHQILPLVASTLIEDKSKNISFFCLAKQRRHSFKFFYEMISRWLLPGKQIEVTFLHAIDFFIKGFGQEIYSLFDINISIAQEGEYEQLQQNFLILETEIALGINSDYFARRILDVKRMSADEKTLMIYENMNYLLRRKPKVFEEDLYKEMQYTLMICRDEFKAVRGARHISRIISILYLFRKNLRQSIKNHPYKRHLYLKLLKADVTDQKSSKTVLGVLVGFNFLNEKEIFEERHLIKAIRNFFPNAKVIENSFFTIKRSSENICTLYLEVEKEKQEEFSKSDIQRLRYELLNDIKNCIENISHQIFMPRNDEEIMRNILILSNQIKFIRDITQVFVSFEEQKESSIFFTIVLVRVLKDDLRSIKQLFEESSTFLEYIHDQTRLMGLVRKKYQKESTVFRVKMSTENFLTSDHSIDLYKARQVLVAELSHIVGDIRDYNGGMISKQGELLSYVRNLVIRLGKNDLFLEKFFYSLLPVIKRTILDPEIFKILYIMFVDSLEKFSQEHKEYYIETFQDKNYAFVLILADDPQIKKGLDLHIQELSISSADLTSAYLKLPDLSSLGYIYQSENPQKRLSFLESFNGLLIDFF